ncbi:MAG TPA: amino acid adenylation domain-containing protein [Pilimelia sp.]|nr:amino acid adenylation domain-containing protein [Pilimelia sp.]
MDRQVMQVAPAEAPAGAEAPARAEAAAAAGALSPAERHRMLVEWNDTARERPPGSLTELFAGHARRTPDRVAVVCGGQCVTYGELHARTNQLARHLVRLGLGPEQVVAVALPRSVEVVVAKLAVLTAGAAYLPIDPDYPLDRIAYMIEDARPGRVLTGSAVAGRLPAGSPTVVLDDPDTARAVASHPTAELAAAELRAPVWPQHPAYVIYTSGSTGRPKAAVIERRSLDDHLCSAREAHPSVRGTSLWHTSVAFAQTVQQLFPPLTAGGSVLVSALEPAAHEVSCTFLKATPSHLPLLDTLPAGFTPAEELMLCGEALLSDALEQWRRDHPGIMVTSGYGPTEVTLHCTEFAVRPGERVPPGVVPLGRVMPNSQVYVLDEGLCPVPPGVTGEIYLGGEGLARGYFRRPDRTAERFVANPFGTPGTRLYRTGDLGRWSADGLLEFGGRADDQVNIRGFRVELGEVSAAVLAHPAVAYAAAVLREDRPGDQRIVCYLVRSGGAGPGAAGDDPLDPAALREHLRGWLPDYMVPAAFVELPALPLTPHGKLDRRALPAPEYAPATPGRAPRTRRETLLCGLFADVLGVPEVGVDDDFFALGGHSLLAARLVGRIRAAFGVELPLRAVFEARCVGALLGRFASAGAPRAPLAPAPRPDRLPLSLAQRRLWFLDRFEGPGAAYHIVWRVRISGALDAAALAAGFGDVLARHEALRTVFAEEDGTPYQVVLDAGRVRAAPALEVVDTDPAALADAVDAAARRAFDLATEPPVRATLFRLAETAHVLLVVLHHIGADGGSVVPLARDLSTAYAARLAGHAPDWAPLPVQYPDYALWQRRRLGSEDDGDSAIATQVEYWRRTLAGLPEVLELPTDRPRPAELSARGDRVGFAVGAEDHRSLLALARQTGTTPFMVLHAALAALLTRMGAGTDITVGTGAAGRDDEALDELVGFFVNTLALRTDTSGDPSFRELLDRVRETDIGAYAHQDVPFERLVEVLNPTRSLAHHPLFQVMLTYEDGVRARLDLPGAETEASYAGAGAAKLDLSFFVWEATAADGAPEGIQGYLEYATDLFDRAGAQAWSDRLVRLLRAVLADPEAPIGAVDVLSEAERHELLVAFNDTRVPVPAAVLPELFAAQVRRVPDAPAVVCDGRTLSYAELDARANRLARMLVRRGLGPERFAGVVLPRSLDLMVALLAVLKAGAAYVAVDATYPPERMAFMLKDADPVVVLTHGAVAARLPIGGDTVLLDDPATVAGCDALPGHDLTDADRLSPLRPRHPAMVIYTSGSTGRPKGAVVEHHSLNHYLAWARHAYPAAAGRSLVHSSVSFDLTVTGLYATLTSGGCVHLIELDGWQPDGSAETPAADVVRPTFVKATPSHLALLLALPDRFSPTEQLVLGGEPLIGEVLDEWRARHPAVTVFNEYGPTETTVECMERRIGPGDAVTPGVVGLGRPSWNTQMYVLDAALRPVPPGVPGEIYIAGELVTRGFHDRTGLTATRYVANPFGPPGSRMYRSGDLGRHGVGGELEFVARVDDQVKIRGYRIELGEVEAVLRQDSAVAHAAVVVREDRPGDKRMVAYVVAERGTALDAAAVRARCAEFLPEYMVPAALVAMETLPLTPNGKVDRRALPAPDYAGEGGGRAPASAREEVLCHLFAEILGVERVGADDNFFSLGGHSLLAVRLISRIRSTFGAELPLRAFFESPTAAMVAERVGTAGKARPAVRRMPRPEEDR